MSVIARSCPICETPLPDEAAFCYKCGTATPTEIDRATGTAVPATTSSHQTNLYRLRKALGRDYELGTLVGRGGFAEVYRVRDIRLKRDLALKVLRPDLLTSDVLRSRFTREAESAAALRHPNIVPIYAVGEAEGIAYILMPLIQGESLKALLDRDGPLPPPAARRILVEAAGGLAAAHDAGMVHRDIKPENIMLEGKALRVLLMDFGIAKAVDTASDEAGGGNLTLTGTGMTVGTPQYMSPEQASGDHQLDHRADQYSLAVVGYQMLSGALPFEASSTRAMLYKQMVEDARPLREVAPDVPADLAAAIERAMSKEPKDRFPSTEAFAQAVAGTATSLPPGVSSLPTVEVPPAIRVRSGPRLRRILLGGTLVVGGLVFGVVWWMRLRPAPVVAVAPNPPVVVPAPVAPPVRTDSLVGATNPPAVIPIPPPPNKAAPTAAGKSAPPGPPKPSLSTATKLSPTVTATNKPASPAAAATCATAYKAADFVSALDLCTREASAGVVSAEKTLGVMYERGQGVKLSDVVAATWYSMAAKAGDAGAQVRIGEFYLNGRGMAVDKEIAFIFLKQAADQGAEGAWVPLAGLYETGEGTKRNQVEAAILYRKAAEKGDVRAAAQLGLLYAKGRGVDRDEAEAIRWYTKAATEGDAESAYQLGMGYIKGKGVAKSDSLGLVWLKRAASQGHQDAQKEISKRGA